VKRYWIALEIALYKFIIVIIIIIIITSFHVPTVRGVVLKTRMKEHFRNPKSFKKGSNIATLVWLNDHSTDFNSAHVIDKGNFRVKKTRESWDTAITSDAHNNAKQLPRQYSILL